MMRVDVVMMVMVMMVVVEVGVVVLVVEARMHAHDEGAVARRRTFRRVWRRVPIIDHSRRPERCMDRLAMCLEILATDRRRYARRRVVDALARHRKPTARVRPHANRWAAVISITRVHQVTVLSVET